MFIIVNCLVLVGSKKSQFLGSQNCVPDPFLVSQKQIPAPFLINGAGTCFWDPRNGSGTQFWYPRIGPGTRFWDPTITRKFKFLPIFSEYTIINLLSCFYTFMISEPSFPIYKILPRHGRIPLSTVGFGFLAQNNFGSKSFG